MLGHDFYHESTRKYITVFGTLFNDILIERKDNADVTQQQMRVPISYGPAQKFLQLIRANPEQTRPQAIALPRIAFEMTDMTYDAERKLTKLRKNVAPKTDDDNQFVSQFVPVPYDLSFSLSVLGKYAEDCTKVVEQILPFFTPEFTPSVQLIDSPEITKDIPIILQSVTNTSEYEGSFETRQIHRWDLTFLMKAYFFGPVVDKKVIKFANLQFYTAISSNTVVEKGSVYPYLPANTAVTYLNINRDDDWDFKIDIEEP
jgi:hypothetical protein